MIPALANIAITVALSCAGILIALRLSRHFAREQPRPDPFADAFGDVPNPFKGE